MELNPLAKLGYLYGTSPMPTEFVPQEPTDQQEPADPYEQIVNDLLKKLTPAQVPQMQQPKTWQNVLGSLSDALMTYGNARQGGQAGLGPYAQQRLQSQRDFAQQSRAAAEENRRMENEARIMVAGERMRAMREKGTAAARYRPRAYQQKTFEDIDESGRPIKIPYNYDPNAGTLAPIAGFEEGFNKYVRPFLAQGIDPETGEIAFKLLDPFSGGAVGSRGSSRQPGAARQTTATPGQVGGGAGSTKIPLEPKPTAAEAESMDAGIVLQNQLDDFSVLSEDYAGQERSIGYPRALGQAFTREYMPLGKELSEGMGDPAYEELATLRDRIGIQLARLVENNRLSDEDRNFALANLPTIASLKTSQGRALARQKIALVRNELSIRMARKRRMRPALAGATGATAAEPETPPDATSFGASILKRLREEGQ